MALLTSSHHYGETTVAAGSSAHFGDNNYSSHHYYSANHVISKLEILHQSLAYNGMDRRARNVAIALPETCLWLRSHQCFKAWRESTHSDEHYGLLWLRGKPGSGKSTLMRGTFEWIKKEHPTELTLSHFFNARSSIELERSTLGMAQCLLYHLLAEAGDEHMRLSFGKQFAAKEKGGIVEAWKQTEIENFLFSLVQSNQIDQITVLIDALDEGEETEIQQMVSYFELLAFTAAQNGCHFRLLFSSRHYPKVFVRYGLLTILEVQEEHTQDIALYIEKALPSNKPFIHQIKHDILSKADHVFLWVVLIISRLKPFYVRGHFQALRAELDKIPADMDSLFASILHKEATHQDETVALFRWLLFSKRNLTAPELYLAIKSCTSGCYDDLDLFDEDSFTSFVVNTSRSLMEISSASSLDMLYSMGEFNRHQQSITKNDPRAKGAMHQVNDDSVQLFCNISHDFGDSHVPGSRANSLSIVDQCSHRIEHTCRVQVIHKTVREFMTNSQKFMSTSSNSFLTNNDFPPEVCQAAIAESCLKYGLEMAMIYHPDK